MHTCPSQVLHLLVPVDKIHTASEEEPHFPSKIPSRRFQCIIASDPVAKSRVMGGVGVSEDCGLGRGHVVRSVPGLGAGDFHPSAKVCCEGKPCLSLFCLL